VSNLNFVTKTRTRQSEMCDVAIRLNRNGLNAAGNPKYSTVFRFSANSVKKIVTNTQYAVYAVDKQRGRVYFAESDAVTGFKLVCPSKGSECRHIQSHANDYEFWGDHVGDYNLLFDRDEKLYYLDFSKKLK